MRADDDAPVHCDRLVIVFEPGEGLCELGDRCPADDLRWNDYKAYLSAHQNLALPGHSHNAERADEPPSESN